MTKKLAIVILAITIAVLWVTPAFAAQGQITEVNPSGVNTVNQANDTGGNDPVENSGEHANENAKKDASGDNSAIDDGGEDSGLKIDPDTQGNGPTKCFTIGCN